MSLSIKSLIRLSQQAPVGSTAGVDQQQMCGFFLYASDDALATIQTAGYFNSARPFLNKGDIIMVTCANSGTPTGRPQVVTAVPASGNITIADIAAA